MKTATIRLEPLACPSCMQKIEGAVLNLPGIDKDTFSIGFNSGRVKVAFDESKTTLEMITEAIEAVGYPVKQARMR